MIPQRPFITTSSMVNLTTVVIWVIATVINEPNLIVYINFSSSSSQSYISRCSCWDIFVFNS